MVKYGQVGIDHYNNNIIGIVLVIDSILDQLVEQNSWIIADGQLWLIVVRDA